MALGAEVRQVVGPAALLRNPVTDRWAGDNPRAIGILGSQVHAANHAPVPVALEHFAAGRRTQPPGGPAITVLPDAVANRVQYKLVWLQPAGVFVAENLPADLAKLAHS